MAEVRIRPKPPAPPPRPKPTRRQRLGLELIEAAMAGLHREVARLLEEGADVEMQDRSGYVAISEAASAGHTVVVGQLLRALADPDRPAQDGRTALHRAAFQNWTTTVRLLLEKGADPELRDDSGATPVQLARSGVMKELIGGWDLQQNREAREERRAQLARMPPLPPEKEEEEEQEEAPVGEACLEAQPGRAGGKPGSALPGRPSTAAAAAAAILREKEEQEAKERAAKEAAKAERERRYQEYLAEIEAQYREEGHEVALADMPPPLTARVRMSGAGEDRLNGVYKASFAAKDRVEFQKEDDPPCQIVWSQYHDEWRILIGDYKLGSTLYRHKYRPNIKADENLGVPLTAWQIWFGKGPCPTLQPAEELGAADSVSLAVAEHAGEASEAVALTEAAPSVPRVADGAGGPPPQRLELEGHSPLKIVQQASEADAPEGARQQGTFEVRLHEGERLVETADGLFSPGEVPEAADAVEEDTLTEKYHSKWGRPLPPSRWNRVIPRAAGENDEAEPAVVRPLVSRLAPSSGKGVPAPRLGGDVEKALLGTLKGDSAQQLAYVKEHLPPANVRRFFKRTPLGPDLLAGIMRVLADLAAEDRPLAEEVLRAVAETPSARTQADMFDKSERECLERLLAVVSPEAAAPWRPQEPAEEG